MKRLTYLMVWTLMLLPDVLRRRRPGDTDRDTDRGDVPGWVMVTVMSAILVVAILGIFEPQIKSALSGILDSVRGAGT